MAECERSAGEMNLPEVTYRKAVVADGEWLFALKRDTMREYVAAVYGWDDDVQRRMFAERFEPARLQIIQQEGRDAGLLEVEERDDHLFLARIEVLPSLQKQGIGSRVLRALLAEANRKGKSVRLQVLRPNPARRLYERLGFRVYAETATHYQMKKEPNPQPGPTGRDALETIGEKPSGQVDSHRESHLAADGDCGSSSR